MLPKAQDRFQEWLRMPLPREAGDARFEIRRASPSEFEHIYDLVDAVFGVRRPRVLYDWLYRRNPGGMARCWIVLEKRSGRMVGSAAHFPWPIARDGEALWGLQVGDSATAAGLQRQGISEMRRRVQLEHPHFSTETRIGWPNEKSIGHKQKHGHDRQVLGPLPEGVFSLEATVRSRGRRWLRRLARAGRGLGGRTRRARRQPADGSELSVETVTRFDSGFDAVTRRCLHWPGFWSPHDADFLNWRYLDHPTRSYLALGVFEGDDVVGYGVIRTEGSNALLMEFAAPERGEVPRVLQQGVLEAVREAGCRRLRFFAPPSWRHWPSFRDAGLVDRPPRRFLLVVSSLPHAALRLRDWQLVPGDSDAD